MFLQNCWYVAATPEEILDKPLGRTICNQPIAFYRDAENCVQAMEDFCPHRGLPLSLGFVENGELVCGYHGLRMGPDGKTISMPKQRVGGFPCVKSFPVIERYGFVWVWPGDPERASEDQLPDLFWADSPDWVYGGGLYHIQADYRLMIDNLMDLTHETYVHSNSIGQAEIDEQPVRTAAKDGQVITSREMENVKAPPFWQMAMKQKGLDPEATVDRWQICRFTPPSHILIDVGVAIAGKGGFDADLEHKAYAIVVDFITPETKTSHWYHWGMARTWCTDDSAMTAQIREGQGNIFSEDLEILERQQASLERNHERKLLMLDIDAGGVQSRRMIDKLLQAESSAA